MRGWRGSSSGLLDCLQQPGHIRNQLHKSMVSTSFHLYNFVYPDSSCCRDKVNRAAGRRAVVMVFASPSGQFYRDVTNPYHLSRLTHLDNFIVTTKSCSSIGTLQKHMPTLTQTATNPNHRAVRLSKNLPFLFITIWLVILQKTMCFVP